MLVYVQNKNGQPLMPTERCGKVRRLLKEGIVKIVKRCPFTIQLLYDTEGITQAVSLGVDAGSKHIGLSATTEKKVLYEADIELRTDITNLLSTRRECRRARRSRKTRYRKPRFNNRTHSKHKGWLAPSVEQKIGTHITAVRKVCELLPVTEIRIEVASFDIQKIKNPSISGTDYQHGEQFNFWNVREYVLFRDGHTCQCCMGSSKDKILNVHHIESRKVGGDAPNNLVALCETCHREYHKGNIKLPEKIKRGASFKDAAFMDIMRWTLYNRLKELYPDNAISQTYGYITKNVRIEKGLPKEHFVDARCISGHPDAVSDGTVYYQKKVRCHNRQIHKFSIGKGGYRKRKQAPYTVKDFRLFDKVQFKGRECFIFGRRSSGSMDIRLLDGTMVSPCAGYKRLRLIEPRKSFLIERRTAASLHS